MVSYCDPNKGGCGCLAFTTEFKSIYCKPNCAFDRQIDCTECEFFNGRECPDCGNERATIDLTPENAKALLSERQYKEFKELICNEAGIIIT